MATINELLSKNLDRKYGPIEAHEVIELVRVTRAPESVNNPSMPSVEFLLQICTIWLNKLKSSICGRNGPPRF
ncbi:hypothetical protein P5764_004595 [Acinetobacter baumannii]